MIYVDTSFLVPMFFIESTSTAVETFIRGLPQRGTLLSDWTGVEFYSFLAKEVRMGGLSSPEANAIDRRFEAETRARFTVRGVTAADFDLAKRYLGDHRSGLRAGDALHLAVATNNGASAICSFDKTMIKVGLSLGLPMNVGFEPQPP